MQLFIKYIILLSLIFAPLTQVWAAQVDDVVEVARSLNESKRKAVIAKNMHFTSSESRAFWPVYNAYRAEMAKITTRLVHLVTDYANNYGKVSNIKAKALLNDFLSIKLASVKLKRKYVPRFSNVLPDKKVTRFYHLENKMDTFQSFDTARTIPLIW